MGYKGRLENDKMREASNSSEALYKEIEKLMDNERFSEAIGALEMLLTTYPTYALAHNDLGGLYYGKGEKEKALKHYEHAAQLDPENPVFQKNLADFYYAEQGRVEKSMELYVKVLDSNPTDIETLLILGHICVSLEKFDDAKVFYNRVLELEPWNMDAREKVDELGKGQVAEDGRRRTEGGGREKEDGWMGGRVDEGTEDGGQGAGVRDQRSIRGNQVFGIGEEEPRSADFTEKAEKVYQDAHELIKSGRDKEGISALERLLEAYPDYALAHNDLGVFCYNEGNKEEALEHYERATQLEPYNDTFQKNLADFYYVEAGRMEEALQIYVKLLEINPTDIEILLIMGQICVSLKKTDDARVFYNKALEIEPWNVDAREKLDQLAKG
jgi:tetratricopeptide (TPR) repeat protein